MAVRIKVDEDLPNEVAERFRAAGHDATTVFAQGLVGTPDDAVDYVSRIEKRIVLIDGEQLAQLMIDHGVGVIETARYTLKKVDHDYFGEE